MSLLYSADKLRLLKPGVKTFLQTSFDRDGHNLRPSNIDNIVGKIYEDLKRLSDSLAPDYFWTAMGDTPNSFSGASESFIGVNTGETALEYKSLKYDNATETLYGTGETLNLGTNAKGILKLQFSTVGNIDYKADLPILSGGIEKARFQQTTGFLGLGTTTPTEYLHSSGGIRVGTATNTNSGTFQWNGTNFQGHNGSGWVNLDITDHTLLSNIGTNTHAQIDAHIADTANPHGVTAGQVGNTTAQWNADRIEGNITNIGTLGAGEDGYALTWDNGTSRFIMAEAGATGLVAIYDATGTPTFYADLSSAITAASSGDTVFLFADINETGATEIALKNGVDINLNGFTYEMSNASTTLDSVTDNNVSVDVTIYNGIIKRSGASGNNARTLHVDNTGSKIKLEGVEVQSTFGYCIYNQGTVDGGKTSNTAGNFAVRNEGRMSNLVNDGYGEYRQDGANAEGYNIYSKSSNYYGIFAAQGTIQNSYGESSAFEGILTQNVTLENCVGISSASSGIKTNGATRLNNCKGYSTANFGIWLTSSGAKAYYCVGESTANIGILINNGSSNAGIYHCTGRSSAAEGIKVDNGSRAVNCTGISTLNTTSGHGFNVANANDRVSNCYAEVTNSGAYGFQCGAVSPYLVDCSGRGMTTLINSGGNSQTNTADAYGNILLD